MKKFLLLIAMFAIFLTGCEPSENMLKPTNIVEVEPADMQPPSEEIGTPYDRITSFSPHLKFLYETAEDALSSKAYFDVIAYYTEYASHEECKFLSDFESDKSTLLY